MKWVNKYTSLFAETVTAKYNQLHVAVVIVGGLLCLQIRRLILGGNTDIDALFLMYRRPLGKTLRFLRFAP